MPRRSVVHGLNPTAGGNQRRCYVCGAETSNFKSTLKQRSPLPYAGSQRRRAAGRKVLDLSDIFMAFPSSTTNPAFVHSVAHLLFI